MLELSMRHRIAVAVMALLVVASSVPLYHAVRQEYIPSDVDEAEFDVNITGPEGASMAAMDEVMRAVEHDLMSTRGVRLVLSNVGGGSIGALNQGGAYVRIAPHDERIFSLSRLFR
jgi:HAE1 family hydrophobic/amphiphilic exporter-1